ncbi:MAG: cytochrome c [Acidobacteriaceae bacterium]|nr:cytochrome c [Acidobacteriaceae bacterium]
MGYYTTLTPSRIRVPPLLVLFVGLLATVPNSAHDVITTKLTYSRDISRIFVRRCVACHGDGASIPLTSYEQVRPWAVDIKEQVLNRRMPPWGAVKGFGDLAPDNGLTEEELLIIAGWVVGGAPEGNPALLPHVLPHVSPHVLLHTPASAQAAQAAHLHDGLKVSQTCRLDQGLVLAGIRPEPAQEVPSARIVAHLPSGQTVPLLWLFHYEPSWRQVFRFREPLPLPAGSVIEADAPVQFFLETPSFRLPGQEQ